MSFTPYSFATREQLLQTTSSSSPLSHSEQGILVDQQQDDPMPGTTPAAASPSTSASATTPPLPSEALAVANRLFVAARQGETVIFEQALSRSERIANLRNEKGDSLIMLASYHGHLPLTKLLLKHGADPNRLNERQQSPLSGSVFKGEDAIVETLLEGGADPRLGNPNALEAVRMFGQQEKWGERLARAARHAEERDGQVRNGNVKGDAHT